MRSGLTGPGTGSLRRGITILLLLVLVMMVWLHRLLLTRIPSPETLNPTSNPCNPLNPNSSTL